MNAPRVLEIRYMTVHRILEIRRALLEIVDTKGESLKDKVSGNFNQHVIIDVISILDALQVIPKIDVRE